MNASKRIISIFFLTMVVLVLSYARLLAQSDPDNQKIIELKKNINHDVNSALTTELSDNNIEKIKNEAVKKDVQSIKQRLLVYQGYVRQNKFEEGLDFLHSPPLIPLEGALLDSLPKLKKCIEKIEISINQYLTKKKAIEDIQLAVAPPQGNPQSITNGAGGANSADSIVFDQLRQAIAKAQTAIKTSSGKIKESKKSQVAFNRWLIASGILIVVALGLILLNAKRSREALHTLTLENDQIKFANQTFADERSKSDSELSRLKEHLELERQKKTGLPGSDALNKQPELKFMRDLPVSGKYFFGEAMVTAGPRKNFDKDAKDGDYGLGEDVAGLILAKDKAFFWVLDGTSDADSLAKPLFKSDSREEEYFSSRLLAQTIGWNLQLLINGRLPEQFNATTMLQQAIKDTEQLWVENIAALDEDSRNALQAYLADRNGIAQCSTTAVFGVLSIDGQLDLCRIGDTKIIAHPSDNNFNKSNGRQFVTLQGDAEQVKVVFNQFHDVRSQSIQLSGIKNVFIMTDGISTQMENWLKGIENIDFSEKNIRQVFTQFKQKTYDDKAMCIIQIKS